MGTSKKNKLDELHNYGDKYIKNVYLTYDKTSDFNIKLVDIIMLESKIHTSHYDLILKSLLNIFTVLVTAIVTITGLKNYISLSNIKWFEIFLITLLVTIFLTIIYILWLRNKKISELKPMMQFTKQIASILLKGVSETTILSGKLEKSKFENIIEKQDI